MHLVTQFQVSLINVQKNKQRLTKRVLTQLIHKICTAPPPLQNITSESDL